MKTTQHLPVNLTQEELVDRGQRMAIKMNEIDKLELELSTAKSRHKAATEALESEVRELRRAIHSREEWRDVEVVHEKDFEARVERTIRLDTGEQVTVRPLDPSEMQGELIAMGEEMLPKRSPKKKRDHEAQPDQR